MRTLLLEGAERLPRWLRTRHSPDTSYQEKLTISSMALGCLTPFGCIHQRFVGLSSPKLANLAPSFSPRYSALHNRTNRAKLTPPWFLPAWLLLVRKVDGFPPMRLARPFGYLQGRRRSDSPRRASARSAVLVVCSGGRAPFGYMVARYDAQNPFRGLPPPITVFEFSTLVVAEKCRLGPRAGFQPAVHVLPQRASAARAVVKLIGRGRPAIRPVRAIWVTRGLFTAGNSGSTLVRSRGPPRVSGSTATASNAVHASGRGCSCRRRPNGFPRARGRRKGWA